MPPAEALLFIATMLLFSAVAATLALKPRLAPSPLVTGLLIAQNLSAVALGAVVIPNGSWWNLPIPLIFIAGSVMQWEIHLAARAGRPSRLVWRQINRQLTRRRGGRRLWSMAELRAEYAQTILDDAERDPELAAILDEFGERIAAETRKIEGAMADGELALLTAYANGYLDTLSEPGRAPATRGYRGYSTDMLMIAAMCRAADRLQKRETPRT